MADPFFDEDDDGDFDDLYGHPAVKHTEPAPTNASSGGPYPPPTSSAQPPPTRSSMEDHGVYSYPVSPASSVPSTTYSRSDTGGRARLSSATTPGRNSMSKPRNRREQSDGGAGGGRNARKARRKGSEELFDVDWEDDSRVKACVVCSSGFSLMKRKHHCRHCGRVMCSDCSTFRYFEVSHKKHRVCSSCNSDLAQRNRLDGREIDDEASYNRSVVTDDELDEDGSFNATPSSSSGKKRGKFRASLKKTFTPKHTKKSGDERRRANEDISNVAASSESNVREGVQMPVHRPLEERKQSSDLFDVADDTWFTDPHEGEARNAASKKQNLFDFDDDDSNFDSRKRNENQRYSLAQPKLGTAADEWHAELSRHTIAGSRGSMPKTTRQDSLSIDAYASRSDDEYDTGKPLRMEMPRPNEWHTESGRHTITGTRGGMPKAMRQDSLSIDAYAPRSDDEYDTGRPLRMEMPRPNQQHAIVKADTRHEEKVPVVVQHAAAHDERGSEEDQSPGRLTLKENLKGMFHIHGKKDGHKKKDKKKDKRNSEPQIKSSSAQPQSTSDRNGAAEKPYAPPQPVVNSQARPTFYDANADDLVVDDTPGYFDRTNSQAYRSSPVEPQQRDTDYSRWASAPLPKSVEPRAILSDADSYSIVETPTPNGSPATTQDSTETKMPVASSSPQEKSGSGLTGVFKRFFGISASKSTDKHTESSQKAPPVVPPTEVEAASSSTSAIVAEDNNSQMVMYDPQPSSRESNVLQRGTSFNRFSMVERSYLGSDANHQLDVSRYTIAEYSNPTTDFPPRSDTVITATTTRGVSMFSSSTSTRDVSQKKRRDTFDDLFESPDSHGKNAAVSDGGRHTLPTRAWDSVATSSTSAIPTTGVSRFDRRRDSDVPQNVPTSRLTERPILDRGRASSIGLGESRFVNEQMNHESNRPAGNTWNAVRAEPTFGVATYAIPSSISSDRFARGSNPRYDERGVSQPTASHSIMEDLHHQPSSVIHPSRETNSLDDFLAEFERPNDYVFDSVTGGYVSASAPKRAKEPVAHRSETNYASMPAQEQRSPVMHIHELQNSRYEQLERYEQPARYDQPQRRKQETVQGEAGGDEDDELDETIVDKISSLEGELAALKQLIRKRKDHEHPPSGSRNSHVAARSSTAVARSNTTVQGPRKMSIFDTNSSDEEEIVRKKPAKKKLRRRVRNVAIHLLTFLKIVQLKVPISLVEKVMRRSSKLDPIQRKAPTKTVKYDELSDEEDFPSLKNRSKTRTASQRKKNAVTTVAAASSSDSEEEKRSKKSSSIATVISKSVATKEVKQPKKKKTLKPAIVDSIDALFDVSDERDVMNFFEQDESKTSKANHLSDAAGESESESDDKVSQKQADSKQRDVAKQEEVVVENATMSDEDSDEEFALSLANAKSGRSQRGSFKSTPVTPSQSSTQEADIKETNSDADSDEEFALSLKNRRAAASPAKRGSQQTDQAVSSSQGLLQSTTQSNDKLVDSDEEFAPSLKKPEHRRVKSVSFLLDAPEQQDISNETAQPHLDVVTEVVDSVDSVSVDSVSLTTRNSSLFDVFDSAAATVTIELKVAPDADAVSSEAAPSVTNVGTPASATQEQESSKLSSSVTSESAAIPLSMDSFDADRESTRNDRSEELIFEATNHILRETRAEVLSIETSRHSSEALTQNTRENSTSTREKHRHSVGDDSFGLFDQSNDPYSMALGSTSLAGDESEEDEDLDDDVNDDQSEMFSFEVQSKKRVSRSVTPSIETIVSRNKSMSDPEESLFLGKYAPSSNQVSSTAIGEQLQHEASVNANDAVATSESPEPLLLDQQLPALGEPHPEVDAAWQQMQEQDKERRKKLQLKQRQAQRDKLLKKQGSRHQLLTSVSSSNNLNAEKAEKKKKKKDKSKDVSEASGSSSRKKSSSRKHKHKHGSTDNDDDERKEAPSTLTEL
uniref:FYVE-type domain-containing protein n=1 Tax=Globisporangium ultimum (strain ATCC 200006 / CBS 805.95 / DAOM BR144) TaxID=431595 RepID=K3WHX8_GLOUD